jgi:hypothetical protein
MNDPVNGLITAARRSDREAGISLRKVRAWYDGQDDSGSNVDSTVVSSAPQTISIEEFNKLQSKYAGAQGFGQEQKKRADALQLGFADYEAKLAAAANERDAAMQEKTRIQSEFEQATQKLTVLEQSQRVMQKIAADEKYAPLAKLQAKGLLRVEGMDDTQLDEYMTNLAAEFASVQSSAVRQTFSGTTPPPPSGGAGAGLTVEQWQDEIFKHRPGTKEYADASAGYINALRASAQKTP